MKSEYYAGLQNEADSVKSKLQLIKEIGIKIITEIKTKTDLAYQEMNDWLGSRFLKEMESIDQLTQIMRFNVEEGSKIKEELRIDQDQLILSESSLKILEISVRNYPQFSVSSSTKVVMTPEPIPIPESKEPTHLEVFTLEQLQTVYNQLSQMAPNGLISIQAFSETLTNLITMSQGTEQLPDLWLQINSSQIETLTTSLSHDGEYIDWHVFMLHISQPWPVPNQNELLEALDAFLYMDQNRTGYVSKEQFSVMPLWFKVDDNSTEDEFDRKNNLAEAFFNMFADFERKPVGLDYVAMLLYFCMHPDPNEGFMRALSVSARKPMPRYDPNKMPMHQLLSTSEEKSHSPVIRRNTFVSKDLAFGKPNEIPDEAIDADVTIANLHQVFHHGQNQKGDSHRFSVSANPEDLFSRDRLAGVWNEFGIADDLPIKMSILIDHPVIQDMVSYCNSFMFFDLRNIFQAQNHEMLESSSIKTSD